jgi:hypothetical protein
VPGPITRADAARRAAEACAVTFRQNCPAISDIQDGTLDGEITMWRPDLAGDWQH